MTESIRIIAATGLLSFAASVHAAGPASSVLSVSSGQCQPQWVPTVGEPAGVNGTIEAMAVFDDGSGPALFVGGDFSRAGGINVSNLAKWDGSRWSDVGGGVNGTVRALTVYDDGSGPALHVGGTFSFVGGPKGFSTNSIAKWDGTEWAEVGRGIIGFVWSLTEFNGDLVVGGTFTHVGGLVGEPGVVAANRIATWNGSNWAALGDGMAGGPGGQVRALRVFDDGLGGGTALYAAGSFAEADGQTVNRIARWDGQGWAGLGDGFNTHVWDLAVFDDGAGDALFAAGEFVSSGSTTVNRIAKWDPLSQSWSSLDGGMNDDVRALMVVDAGEGERLIAAGDFTTAGGNDVTRIARWDGAIWQEWPENSHTGVITSLALFDAGQGAELYVAGSFIGCGDGGVCDRVARWSLQGGGWNPLGNGINNAIRAMAVFDDGDGPALYVAGIFASANGQPMFRIGRWDPATHTLVPLGDGVGGTSVYDLAVFDDGTGEALYAVGSFTTAGGEPVGRVARWDGTSWSSLGSGLGGIARALAVFDDGTGPALYVGGQFTTTGDGLTVNRIARWDGQQWSAVGTGMNQTVSNLIVLDDGRGAALYASGGFTTAGGVTVNRIAKWDGTNWSGLGSPVPGVPALVTGLGVYDDQSGGGEALYVSFDAEQTSNGVTVNRIAKWDGSNWSPLGSGLNHTAAALQAFDDGTGEGQRLYVGGAFTEAGGEPIEYLAVWDGHGWSAVGSWSSGLVSELAAFDDGIEPGASLFVGGSFQNSPAGDGRLAQLAPCGPACQAADLNCDGVVDVSDLLQLLSAWGACDGGGPCDADLTGDDVVDVSDLLILLSDWGNA